MSEPQSTNIPRLLQQGFEAMFWQSCLIPERTLRRGLCHAPLALCQSFEQVRPGTAAALSRYCSTGMAVGRVDSAARIEDGQVRMRETTVNALHAPRHLIEADDAREEDGVRRFDLHGKVQDGLGRERLP